MTAGTVHTRTAHGQTSQNLSMDKEGNMNPNKYLGNYFQVMAAREVRIGFQHRYEP